MKLLKTRAFNALMLVVVVTGTFLSGICNASAQ